MEKYTETLKANLFLQTLKKELETPTPKPQTRLTGGAVVDILRGVVPKDYDFIHTNALEKAMRENLNFKLIYTSKSAVTFLYNNTTIQLLYKSTDSFPYTIEQGIYDLFQEKLDNFDEQSFVNKVLVPTKKAFEEISTAKIGVKRLLHWQHKGWHIQNITFQSLLGVAFKSKCKNRSYSEDDEDLES